MSTEGIPHRLPGVGHELQLLDEDGHPFTVVRRKDGVVELHGLSGAIVLGPAQARALGGFVAGHLRVDPELVERLADGKVGLEFDWVHVPRDAAAAGRTIEELAIRRRTGTTVVAILRGARHVVDPGPDQIVEAGDDLVVIGRSDDRDLLERLLRDGT